MTEAYDYFDAVAAGDGVLEPMPFLVRFDELDDWHTTMGLVRALQNAQRAPDDTIIQWLLDPRPTPAGPSLNAPHPEVVAMNLPLPRLGEDQQENPAVFSLCLRATFSSGLSSTQVYAGGRYSARRSSNRSMSSSTSSISR